MMIYRFELYSGVLSVAGDTGKLYHPENNNVDRPPHLISFRVYCFCIRIEESDWKIP
jgi:hypothetical protein